MRTLHGKCLATFVTILAAACASPAATAEAKGKPGDKPAAGKRPPAVKGEVKLKPTVAHIRLAGAVLASPPEMSWFIDGRANATLQDWLERLAKARNDPHVEAVALEVDAVSMDWSQAREFADAVERLNKVKPVHAHLTGGGALSYLVASAARDVSMEPSGTLMIVGLGAELLFFRGTLDWLGIRPQMVQIGRYKGAAEPFSRTGPSKEFKGEYDKILDDLYDQLCTQIARQRRLTVPHVRQAIDDGPLDGPMAKEYRLVDRLVPRTDWQDHVVRQVAGKKHESVNWQADYGRKTAKQLDFSNPFQLLGTLFARRPGPEVREPTIAIIHADGMIIRGASGQGLFGERIVGSRTMVKCFRDVAANDKIKAVILRINSPGGSALASELIYQAVRKCGRKKPVIASISGLGASGGYYIALGAGRILADPPALTGSIGVVGGKLAFSGLLAKIGVSTYEITRGRNAGLRMSRPWNEREEAVIRKLVERTYGTFVSRVKDSRGKRIKDVASVAQGRVFTARQAVANGLIDEIGGLREAVAAAQSAAKIKKSFLMTLPRPRTLLDVLTGADSSSIAPSPGAAGLAPAAFRVPSLLSGDTHKLTGPAYLLGLARMLADETILTAMPYFVSVEP